MVTKTKAKSTSSLSPMANELAIPDASIIIGLMTSAFEDTKTGSELNERGSQRAIAAIMFHAAELIKADSLKHALRDCALDSDHGKQAREAFNEIMVGYFVKSAPDSSDMTDEETNNVKRVYDNHKKLVQRSIRVAGAMEANGITFTHYSMATNRFSVYSTMLYPRVDAVPEDRLLDYKMVDLDGESIAYKKRIEKGPSKGKLKSVTGARASVNQLMSICGIPAKPRAATPQGTPPATGAVTEPNWNDASLIATKVSVETLLTALHECLIKNGPNEPIPEDTMAPKYWNMYADLSMRLHESQASWVAPTKQAKAA